MKTTHSEDSIQSASRNKISIIEPKVDISVETTPTKTTDVVAEPTSTSTSPLTSRSKEKLSPWNSSRWAKLPIRPPKLRFGDKPIPTKSRRIVYGSVVRTRSLDKSETIGLVPIEYINSSKSSGQDILELSSSEKLSSRLRLSSNSRDSPTNHQQSNGPSSSSSSPSSSTSSSSRPIPNLLAPKFSRPAMYSLNGYIPKPNIQRFSTTISPVFPSSSTQRPLTLHRFNHHHQPSSKSSSVYNRNEFVNYNQKDKNLYSKKFGSKYYHELEDSIDGAIDLKISGSAVKNRQLSKRRGYLSPKDTNADHADATDHKHSNGLNNNANGQWSSNPSSSSGRSSYRYIRRKGEPGKDFPLLKSIPRTSFECKDQTTLHSYYADLETGCQVWHMCQGHRKHSFLCPNGTIFNQKSGVCDWWYNVDCQSSYSSSSPSSSPVGTNKRTSTVKSTEVDETNTKEKRMKSLKNGRNIFESILSGKRRFL